MATHDLEDRDLGEGAGHVLVIDGCYVATVDAAGTEYPAGHVVIDSGRIAAVGPGPVPADCADAERVDGSGLLVTPGLVNTHHHLYQWITRGYATDDTLFGWLTTLYPVWARLDAGPRPRLGRGEPGLDGAHRLHARRSTTTTSFPAGARRPARGRDPSRPGGSACASTRPAAR